MAKEPLDDLERLRAQAWEQHPDHAILIELKERRDETGQRTWIEVTRPDPTDPTRTNLWLQPMPGGKPILIGSWQTPAD